VTQKLQTRCGALEYRVAGAGEPAIVLFNGAGVTLEGWRTLYPRIEDLGTVIAWNRFGVEGSDSPARLQSGALVVASVRELLHYTGVEPPFILVGHSLGALYADLFARLHPHETAGVLFLQRADPDRIEQMDEGALVRSLRKAHGSPDEAFRDNLRAEIDAVRHLEQELESAGPFPPVPVDSLVSERGHFPQVTEPELVLDALARLVRRARQASANPLVQP
jgi:pimeloyl-ACP methyl ester carboxylesterase